MRRIVPSLGTVLVAAALSLLPVAPHAHAAERVAMVPYPPELYAEARREALAGGLERAVDLWREMLASEPGPLYSVDLATSCGDEATVELLDQLSEVHPVLALPSGGERCRRILFGLFPEEQGVERLVRWLPSVSMYPPTLVRIEDPGAESLELREIRRFDVPLAGSDTPATSPVETAAAADAATPDEPEAEPLEERAVTLFEEGKQALMRRDFDAAGAAFEQVLEIDPNNVSALHNLGTVRLYRQDFAGAVDLFERALARDPQYVKAYLNLAAARFAQGSAEEALAVLQDAAGVAPDDFEVQYTLAAMSAETDRFEEAWKHLDRALEIQPEAPRAQALARALPPRTEPGPEREAATREAAPQERGPAEEARASGGRLPEPRLRGMEPQGKLVRRTREAPAEPRSQPEAGPADPGPMRSEPALSPAERQARAEAERHFQRGARAYDQGDLREAERELLEAARIDPRNPNIHNNLGAVYVDQGRWQDAAEAFRSALSADPEHLKARINLGGALYNLDRREDAIQILEEAEAMAPRDPEVLYTLALFLTHDGHRDRARQLVTRALEDAPFNHRLRALQEVLTTSEEKMYVAEPEVFLRQSPDRRAGVVGKIRYGQALDVIQRKGEWLRVRVREAGGMEGWVVDGMLTRTAPATSASS